MTYFCVSDIHGYYDVLIKSLTKSGFDESKPNHKIIVIGDMTDRGPQSLEVLEYIYKLHKNDKAIVILGNHDYFLCDFFKGNFERTHFNILKNGHKETIDSLLGYSMKEDTDFLEEQRILLDKYPHIYLFLEELPLYYELGEYIFVHGGIDVTLENWRNDTIRNFTWNKQHLLPSLPGKIIVVGHTQAVRVRTKSEDYNLLYKTNPEMFDILYGEGTIHIDGSVHTTKNINVLKLEI